MSDDDENVESKHGMDASDKHGAEKPTAGGETSDEGGEHSPDDTPVEEGVGSEGLGTKAGAGGDEALPEGGENLSGTESS